MPNHYTFDISQVECTDRQIKTSRFPELDSSQVPLKPAINTTITVKIYFLKKNNNYNIDLNCFAFFIPMDSHTECLNIF